MLQLSKGLLIAEEIKSIKISAQLEKQTLIKPKIEEKTQQEYMRMQDKIQT